MSTSQHSNVRGTARASRLQMTLKEYKRSRYLLLLLFPGLLWYGLFHYAPLYGIQLAFKDFRALEGIMGSPWVGFKYFDYMFTSSPEMIQVFRNTVLISLYHIVFGFPAPIILALLLNEIRSSLFKRVTQTISYLPHFLSWIVMGGLLIMILSPSTGIVNDILQWFGFDPIYFLASETYFRSTLVISAIWKEIGWSSIIYLAALASVDPHLYEAAVVDGANRWKQTLHITLPSMIPVIAIMFILRIGSILDAGFDQILNLYNPAVFGVADIIDTYVYRVGLTQLDYGLPTAVNLFKNVIAFSLVILTSYLIKKSGEEGLV